MFLTYVSKIDLRCNFTLWPLCREELDTTNSMLTDLPPKVLENHMIFFDFPTQTYV